MKAGSEPPQTSKFQAMTYKKEKRKEKSAKKTPLYFKHRTQIHKRVT